MPVAGGAAAGAVDAAAEDIDVVVGYARTRLAPQDLSTISAPTTTTIDSGIENSHHSEIIMDANSINAILVDDEQPSTSAQAAAAAAVAASSSSSAGATGGGAAADAGLAGSKMASNGINHNAEMPADWMRIADEGRYGTPGAAGLEYQKYDQQQQQLEDEEAGAVGGVGATTNTNESKKLEELHALTSDELYETLKEYDALQDKYHTVLLLPKESRVSFGGISFSLI